MLKKIFLVLSLIALLVSYGLGFIPVDYKFGEETQSGLASLLVESKLSNYSMCILDVYTMEETTDMTIAKVKTTTTVQFNASTYKKTVKFTVVDDEGNVKADAQSVLDTLGLSDFEKVGYYKVINRKIYLLNEENGIPNDAEAYTYELDTFYQIREKGDTENTYLNSIAVGFTVIFVGTLVASLIFFAIKKPEER